MQQSVPARARHVADVVLVAAILQAQHFGVVRLYLVHLLHVRSVQYPDVARSVARRHVPAVRAHPYAANAVAPVVVAILLDLVVSVGARDVKVLQVRELPVYVNGLEQVLRESVGQDVFTLLSR